MIHQVRRSRDEPGPIAGRDRVPDPSFSKFTADPIQRQPGCKIVDLFAAREERALPLPRRDRYFRLIDASAFQGNAFLTQNRPDGKFFRKRPPALK